MTTLRDAAQMALEALKDLVEATKEEHGEPAYQELKTWRLAWTAINALNAALEQPQTTHSADCWRRHHECAVAKIERECNRARARA